jgi:hypothetical protein
LEKTKPAILLANIEKTVMAPAINILLRKYRKKSSLSKIIL